MAALEGKTNNEIVDRSGLDRGTVAKVLANKEPFHFRTAEKLLDAYDLEFQDSEIYNVSEPKPSASAIAPNPFSNGEAEKLLSRHAGREEILRRLFEELDKRSSRSVVGDAGLGKTWLLRQICDRGATSMTNSPDGFIRMDMHQVSDGQDFFEALCEELGLGSCSHRALEKRLRGKHYVLCLDEIHVLADESRFEVRERDYLRGLADSGQLALVIASQKPLRTLFPDSPLRSSPLADLCDPQIDLKPISESQVQKFVEACGIRLNEQRVTELWEQSQGKPKRLLELAAKRYQEQ